MLTNHHTYSFFLEIFKPILENIIQQNLQFSKNDFFFFFYKGISKIRSHQITNFFNLGRIRQRKFHFLIFFVDTFKSETN